jgi:tetratricopeptide (TPR) repeat protein
VSALSILHVIKEYWFLITLLISLVVTLVYMVVFRVNPWDVHRETKQRREQIRFHGQAGYALLEAGHFKQSKEEFERALSLKPTDHTALNGRYLCDLFLAMDSPVWNPAIGLVVQHQLAQLGVIRQHSLIHVVEKYLGDLHYKTGKPGDGKRHYENALALKPDYIDALYTLGWFHYLEDSDVPMMERCFRKMVGADGYDYRGYHGLGYALYMQAIKEEDAERRKQLITDAASQGEQAKNLSINTLNIVMDFGEIARSANPSLSVYFHERGLLIVDDPVLSAAGDNPFSLTAQMLTMPDTVFLDTPDRKRAWIHYQLALDQVAMKRLGFQTPETEDALMEKARALDTTQQVYPVYVDQLTILDRFLPPTK